MASHLALCATQTACAPARLQQIGHGARSQHVGWQAAAARSSARGTERQQRRRELSRLAARSGGMPDPMRSPLFQSEIFQKEIDDMFKELMSLSPMMGKSDFDIDGKKLFLEHMDGVTEKLRVIITRLKLADDAVGNELLRMTGVQMLNANTNLEMMVDGLRAQMDEMRAVIAREEATCDPAELALIKRAWEERFPRTGQFDLGRVMSDPSIAEGFTDPQAIKAANEVATDPSKIENYRDRPALYNLLKTTFGL